MATKSKSANQSQPAKTTAKTTLSAKNPSEQLIREIRRNTRKIFTSEQKVLIVMEGIRAELSISELCRKYGISTQTYYTWNKEFIEAGKRQLSGDTLRQATSSEVAELKAENAKLKESLADLVVRYDIVKKACHCWSNLKVQTLHETYGSRKSGDHPHRQAFGTWRK